jgi:tRNA modification GTPase
MSASTSTIAALSTPPGRGALAVIRLSGDNAHEIFAAVVGEKEKFIKESARQIGIYTIVDDNGTEIIDEITAIKYNAPRSFTGENMVEIFCHGGAIIPRKILDRLFMSGAEAAGRGEFSRRALLNGKMDLLKAESIAGLIDCQTEKHLESAQLAYQGKQLKSLEKLKRKIINILSDIESRIEFAEDDDVAESESKLIIENKRELELIISELEEDLRRSDMVKSLDEGIIIALAGPPNAGKSSLFNEILGYDRSIVHDVPGTTRDAVSEKIVFEGITVKLFDCAGIRITADAVEQRGIERTLSAIKDAHIVFWVTSADTPLTDDERNGIIDAAAVDDKSSDTGRKKTLIIINKIDIVKSEEKKQFCADRSLEYIEISLREKINADALFAAIKSSTAQISEDMPPPEIIINDRHRRIIAAVASNLRDCVFHYGREELSAHYLKKTLDLLAEFLGHTAGDEVLNEIFEKFCIGK